MTIFAGIAGSGARLVYLPPYLADFNPIEPAWSQFKSHLRARATRTKPALTRVCGERLACIRAQDARNYFAHCGYR